MRRIGSLPKHSLRRSPLSFPSLDLSSTRSGFRTTPRRKLASVGMGIVYTHGSLRQPIRHPLTQAERRSLIEQYYNPHHAQLTAAVQHALERHGKCLVLDCHSYPSEALAYELHRAARRPQICLGTDDYHSPELLVSSVESRLEAMGFEVARERALRRYSCPSGILSKGTASYIPDDRGEPKRLSE